MYFFQDCSVRINTALELVLEVQQFFKKKTWFIPFVIIQVGISYDHNEDLNNGHLNGPYLLNSGQILSCWKGYLNKFFSYLWHLVAFYSFNTHYYVCSLIQPAITIIHDSRRLDILGIIFLSFLSSIGKYEKFWVPPPRFEPRISRSNT